MLTQAQAVQQLSDDVSAIVAKVPAGVNPFPYIRSALYAQVHPSSSASFKYQLYALSGLYAIPPFILLASLVVKWRQGELWFFRWEKLGGRRFLLPHYTSPWTFVMAVAACIYQGFIWASIRGASNSPIPMDGILWRTLTWLAPYLGLWLATWSLVCTHVIFLDSTGKPRRFYSSARFLNLYGVLVPILFFGAILPLGVIASQHYQAGIRSYLVLDATLEGLEQSWDGSLPLAALQGAAQVGASFLVEFDMFISFFQATFACYCGAGLVTEGTFITFAVIHLRTLKQTLADVKNGRNGALPSPQETMVRGRYRSLAFVTIILSILISLFEAIFLFTAVDSNRIVKTASGTEGDCLLALYACGIPLFLLSIYLLVRSFDPVPPSSQILEESNSTALELPKNLGEPTSPAAALVFPRRDEVAEDKMFYASYPTRPAHFAASPSETDGSHTTFGSLRRPSRR